MTVASRLWGWKLGAIVCSASFMGCGGQIPSDTVSKVQTVQQETAIPTPSDAPSTNPVKNPQAGVTTQSARVDPRYSQPFDVAAIVDAVPEDQQLPPDVTLGGKATGQIRSFVEKVWSDIPLMDAQGKPIPYQITIETDRGSIVVQLNAEKAPNHVRNLLALAKVGYYEKLLIDSVIHQESQMDGQKVNLDLLRAGCPLGTGELGIGHLGYFLKPEIDSEAKHEIGTVGFWHEADRNSACCRLYITLSPAPVLDGEFTTVGKVVQGIDLLQRLAKEPLKESNIYPDKEQPVRPAVIQRVQISPALPE